MHAGENHKIWQRPFKSALISGFKNGGKHALLFASPIMLVGAINDYSVNDALFFPAFTGLLGATFGSATGVASSLLPIKQEGEKLFIRETFIKRAGTVGAHTGTSFGIAALMTCLFYHLHVR